MVDCDRACFKEEIEAWDFGPVVPEVYHYFKIFGSANIPKSVAINAEIAIMRSDRPIINEMVDQCAEYSASALVELTHNQDPWRNAYRKGYNNIINQEAIRAYFDED